MTLQVASLFTGVGGIDLAFERAGAPTRLMCEYDKAARSVLARHYPGVPIHHDVRELTHHDLTAAGLRPDTTIVTGGFPCQDLSLAGARRGMGHGTRSGLFWHIIRLLADFRAAWVVLENVPGILSATCPCTGDGACLARGAVRCPGDLHSVTGGACEGGCVPTHGGVMGAVIGALGELGYGLAWRVLDAQYFGVPQRRRRVVIVGHLGAPWGAPAEVLLEPAGLSWDSAPLAGAGSSAPGAAAGGSRGRRIASALTAHHGRMTAEDADNLVTFQKVIRSGYRDAAGNLPPEVWAERSVSSTLSPFDLASESRAVDLVAYPMALRGRAGGSACEIGEPGDPAFALRAGDGGSSRSQLVAVSVTGDRTHALTAGGHDASEDGTGRGCPVIAFQPQAAGNSAMSIDTTAPCLSVNQLAGVHTETVVRRLTPLECERLQGAPDGWTDGQADSPRYRQLGNAVAVPVFEWVGRRLAAVDATIRVSQETP